MISSFCVCACVCARVDKGNRNASPFSGSRNNPPIGRRVGAFLYLFSFCVAPGRVACLHSRGREVARKEYAIVLHFGPPRLNVCSVGVALTRVHFFHRAKVNFSNQKVACK